MYIYCPVHGEASLGWVNDNNDAFCYRCMMRAWEESKRLLGRHGLFVHVNKTPTRRHLYAVKENDDA